ncbi:MAG: mannose-1-phosphate guanylyltransferase/mannose-6-phosphate isomerase [Desulfobacterales bacterium]|nr:MAG: mannose-1-phosphate guanylyltransferase/mannose-6-phosphate isomerase [Desulfobacterales bacterium]
MPDLKKEVYAVLLAGGTGTRLWPVSRALYPKQLVKFIGDDSLVQSTIKRLDPVLDTEKVKVVCGERHFHEIARHMEDIGLRPEGKIICEPVGRNTAPAILLAVFHILKATRDAILCVFPADHVIADVDRFHERLKAAVRLADRGDVVTFGIQPGYPETGYGYVEAGAELSDGALAVKRFVEKPDQPTAQNYIDAGNFFWNSGMFAFRASVILEEFRIYQPDLLQKMDALFTRGGAMAPEEYAQLPDISIDYAIMEKTTKGAVLPSDFGWSDIGSWKSLYDFLPKDADHNVIDGDVIAQNTRDCFIMGRERLIATNHLRNMVVVETPDSIFVSDIDRSRDVKNIVARLKEQGRKEYHRHRTVFSPWGKSTVLEHRDDCKIEKLVIYAGASVPMEDGGPASRNLLVLKGRVRIDVRGRSQRLGAGESAAFRQDDAVSIANPGDQPAYLIRVQIEKT